MKQKKLDNIDDIFNEWLNGDNENITFDSNSRYLNIHKDNQIKSWGKYNG